MSVDTTSTGLYVVEVPDEWSRLGAIDWPPLSDRDWLYGMFAPASYSSPEVRDANEHDGQWPAFITLDHESVEWEGRAVPLFADADPERTAWEEARRERRR